MAEINKRKKALAVSPLKASQTMGAALAYLGFNRSMPLMHGSQGCTAFAKVFFVRHFREPIPLQTTAMDQVSSIMGADDNIVEALKTISEKQKPALIGLCSTGLAETQGCDLNGAVGTFRRRHPEFDKVAVVSANTPDFSGCFETGYALALKGIIESLVPESDRAGRRQRQVNVLCGSFLTPGDLEYICDTIESFGLRPLLIPDLSGSLDGHLPSEEYSPLTTGGLTLDELATCVESRATLVIGASLVESGQLLEQRSGVKSYNFSHLHTLQMVDRWLMTLAEISGSEVPGRWRKHRAQLQDAMLDTHFMLGQLRVAIAADPDLLLAMHDLVVSMGAEVVTAVASARGPALTELALPQVQIGDLEDLEQDAREYRAELLIGNSHLAETSHRLHAPHLRAGFPQYDYVGGFQRVWCGYRGIQQTLFDIANLKLSQHEEIKPYHSIYAQKQDGEPTMRMAAGA
ncbi:nitrogenase iron-molybdenum cofactor biosynthesis protein NifN [Marinobacterium zhoushanense]|uniref:Nitrogenase iron-molybdenum cofactor biosynthesis protein NifN n=1 Tax=Marinobacterium zhoushanense TaxID=1679163 RepID=A0ABQ1KFY9_9GAMM|nr:nitrogenase iron-molybdenum cofactor biosynthesis protein NifN [Marinobacterium zhoushanense]GGB94633.1 nitrogenase iron-molybdenum cofactor biosynthesis protein NifN [Marinobacterium zhoushanense]